MKVLVTGSSGFLGTWVSRELVNSGYRVFGLDRREPSEEGVEERHITCDLLDRSKLDGALSDIMPDAVIHLAARTDLDETENIGGYETNIGGVRNLVEAIRECSSCRRAVYTSSQLVCRLGYVPENDQDYTPHTLYGESKVRTEQIVREGDGGGVEWCLVRPTTAWGPGMGAHYQKMLRLIKRGRFFHSGGGELPKSYGYVKNMAYQYRKLLEAPAEDIHGSTFYLADYEPLSLRRYCDELAQFMGAPRIPTIPLILARMAARAGDLLNRLGWKSFPYNSFRLNNIRTEYVFDLSDTMRVCGEQLPYTAEEGIAETARWFVEKEERER